MTPVQIAFYKPHRRRDLAGRLVCWWTRSPYSHCEIVADGLGYSSSILDGGVRRKKIDFSKPHWVLVDLPGVASEQVLRFFERTRGRRYGWLDLITQQVLRLPLSDKRGWFCSEWAARLIGLARPETWHPGMLAEYLTTRD